MADTQDHAPNRGAWIIAGAILVATGLIVGVMLFKGSKDDACKRWQADVQEYGGDESFAAFVLGDERPDACPLP